MVSGLCETKTMCVIPLAMCVSLTLKVCVNTPLAVALRDLKIVPITSLFYGSLVKREWLSIFFIILGVMFWKAGSLALIDMGILFVL